MTVTSACSAELLDLVGQRARCGGVTLADVGGEDQDTPGAGNPGCGFAVAAWHIGRAL